MIDYDIICLAETFQGPSVENDNDRISIPGYNLLRVDHPSNTRRGVFVFIARTIFLL